MSSPKGTTQSNSSPRRPLSERVAERVKEASVSLAADKHRRRRADAAAKLLGGQAPQELRALRRVFKEMGSSQRAARHQTGQAPSPVVREAAQAFRRDPSLPALVLVAASLDEVGLLSW